MSDLVAQLDMSEWRKFLQEVQSKGRGVTKILRMVFNLFGFKDINEHFREESGPEGAWAKRKASTQAMYEAIASGRRNPPKGMARASFNPTNKILQLTGFLRQSILPTNIRNVTQNSIMIFSNAAYSRAHDEGGRDRGLAKRPFMWLSDSTLDKMAQSAAQFWLKSGEETFD